MIQTVLIGEHLLNTQTINIDNIKAVFTKIESRIYEVLLEISSHKFFLKIKQNCGKIESLEIISIKGFLEISNKITDTIKKLIEHLIYRLT